MSKHLRVLRVFADGEPRSVDDVYRSLPRDAYLGSVVKDLVRDGRLERVDSRHRITPAGLDRLARSTVRPLPISPGDSDA